MSPIRGIGHGFSAPASSLRLSLCHGFLSNPFAERWSTFLMHALIRLFSLPLSHRLVSWLSAPRRPVSSLAALALVFFASAGGVKAAVPTDIGLSSVTITQSTATVGTTIATLTTLDADVGDTHTYSFAIGPGSTNNGSFAIVGATLRVGPVALNAGSYTLRLRTTDSTANNYEEIVIITVTDNVQPVITGTVAPNNASYAAGAQLIFTAYFSEPVTVSTVGGTPRIALTLDTGGTVFATYLAGSGSLAISFRYIVQPGDIDLTGIGVAAAIDLNGGTIRDTATNNAILTLNGVGSTAGIVIDGVQLTVMSVAAPASGNYRSGGAMDFVVTFSKTTFVDLTGGTPRLQVLLESGTTAYAVYTTGHATNQFTFRYTVAVGDFDTNGVTLGSAVQLNGSVIRDNATNPLATTLNNIGTLTAVLVDGVPPAVESSLRNTPSPTAATSVAYTVKFVEPVSGVDIGDFELTTTGTAGGSLATLLQTDTVTYVITISNVGGDGTLRLDLRSTGTAIIDAVGNPILGGYTAGQVYTVDNTKPSLVISGPSVASTETGPVSYTLTYTGADTISLQPNQIVVNATGTVTAVVQITGSGNTTRTVTLENLTGAGTVGISVAAGTATDGAGNASLAAGPSAVIPVNPAPTLVTPIPNQTVGYKTPFVYTVPADTFVEPNPEQTLTFSATGLPAGITFDPATRSFSGIAAIGTAQITVTATDNGVPARSTSSTFTLSVIKAVLTVRADNQTRAYGAANPTLTVTYTGFVGGETLETSGVTGLPVIATTAVGTTPVGTVPITASIGTLAATNYSFTLVPGTLTVTKAVLTVKAEDKTRIYNTINPPLTYTLTGLVNGETLASVAGAPELSTEVTAVTNVGTYPIVIRIGTLASTNYSFTSLVNGTFTVAPAPVTITLSDLFKVYTGQPQSVTATTSPSGNRVKFTYNGSASAPVEAGSYTVVATSDDSNFAGTATATMSIAKASQTLTFNPPSAAVGTPITLTATSSVGLPVTFALISGNATLTGSTLTLLDTASVTVRAIQAGNANYSSTSLDRSISATSRLSQTINYTAPGDLRTDAPPFSLRVSSSSGLPVTITLQSGPALLTGDVVTLTGSVGTVSIRLSQAGNDTFAPAADVNLNLNVTLARNDRIINLSSRSKVATSGGVLITGFVIGGNAAKPVLIRGIGPSLAQFGVQGAMTNPTIRLYRDSTLISENTGWTTGGNAAALAANFARLGAFALETTSADSAMLVTLQPGGYSVHVTGGVGVVLAEIYDASVNPQAEVQRLVNISVRNDAGTGDDALIGGFVITGTTSKRVLIRGVGPALVPFGVTNALADSRVQVFSGQTQIGENDNWSTVPADATAVAAAAASVGAFALPVGSKDAALVLTLAPGGYTLQVSSAVAGSAGVALIEVYELP
ncbi:MAG: putative Ig domain-containing protein [Opitutaceae bacterium]|nr:putative Ig domain-containing protein [Opitutaceae bacterium]